MTNFSQIHFGIKLPVSFRDGKLLGICSFNGFYFMLRNGASLRLTDLEGLVREVNCTPEV